MYFVRAPMRLVKKIFFYTLGTVLSFFLLTAILVTVFEDDIKAYAVKELNKRLNTKVDVDYIDLSIWDNFPNASLCFHNVTAYDAYLNRSSNDTLFHAQTLYLEFDVFDLIDGDYNLKEISAESGKVAIRIDETGDGNYHLTKPSEEEGEEVTVDLRSIELSEFQIMYENKVVDEEYAIWVDETDASGTLSGDEFDASISANGVVNFIRSGKVKWMQSVPLELNSVLSVNAPAGIYKWDQTNIQLGNLGISVTGTMLEDSVGMNYDLAFNTTHAAVSDLFTVLPPSASTTMKSYASSGNFQLSGSVVGVGSDTTFPAIAADFSLNDASIRNPGSGVELQQARFEGSFESKGENGAEELMVRSFYAEVGDGKVEGQMTVRDFSDPYLNGALTADIGLQFIAGFAPQSGLRNASGRIRSSVELDCKTSEWETNPQKAIEKTRLSMELRDIAVSLEDGPEVKNMRANVNLQGANALLRNAQFQANEGTFTVNGALQNLVPFLFGKKNLNVVADVESDKVLLDKWLAMGGEGGGEASTSVNINLDVNTDLITYDKLKGEGFTGNITMIEDRISLQNIRCRTMGGSVWANAKFVMRDNGDFEVSGKVNAVDVPTVFASFRNFDQNVVMSDQIEGTLTSDFRLRGKLNNKLEPKASSLAGRSSIQIANGRLHNLAVFDELIDYIRENKMADLFFKKHLEDLRSRLADIRFDDLKNELVISNNMVSIPSMEIRSSALDLNMEGTHSLDDNIDYHMDFLFKRLKMQEEVYTEFGKITDDNTGMRIFVHMYGTSSDPTVELDRERKAANRREKIKEEEEQVKALLQQEFGLFKKDTTLHLKETPREEAEFLILDDDDTLEDPGDLNKPERERPRRNKERINRFYERWLKQEETEKEQEAEIEIEAG